METATTSSLEARLDRIESALTRITNGMDQMPPLVSIAADSVDDAIQASEIQGTAMEDRLTAGLSLLSRISEPRILNALTGLIDNMEQAPGLVAMTADMVDDGIHEINNGKYPMSERIDTLVHLADELTRPSMAARIDDLLTISDQAPGLVAMVVDTMDSFMSYHGETISDCTSFLKKDNLLFLKNVGEAVTKTQEEPIEKIGGVFSILRALNDPDRQKAIGFLMNVLKNLGKTL